MKTNEIIKNEIIHFGRVHYPASNVKIVGSKDILAGTTKLNRLTTQNALESKKKTFPKRKPGKNSFSYEN